MYHPPDRIAHTTAFVTPVVEHWLERVMGIQSRYQLGSRLVVTLLRASLNFLNIYWLRVGTELRTQYLASHGLTTAQLKTLGYASVV